MRKSWLTAFTLIALAIAGAISVNAARAQGRKPVFVHAKAIAPKTVTPGKPFVVTISLTIDKPYHIQGNPTKQDYIATEVTFGPASGFKVGKVTYPKAITAKIAGDTLPVYEGTVEVKATLTADKTVKSGLVVVPVTIKYQGCDQVACFPPNKIMTQARLTVGGAKHADLGGTLILAQAQETKPSAPSVKSEDITTVAGFRGKKLAQFVDPKDFLTWLKSGQSQAGEANTVANLLLRGGVGNLALALGLIYLLGLALNLTPCVYPLIPITIGYFGRQAANGAKTGALSTCYALGMALMYTILGLFAALLGKGFGAQLGNPVVLVVFAALMFALGLSNFDRPDGRPIWELQLPSSITGQAKSRAGYAGAAFMGMMVGVVAAPCIGPVVVALIQVIGSTRNLPLGALTFFILGIGLATPYLLLGFGLIKALPRAGEWMVAVKHIFGLLLFGMGIYYLRDLLGPRAYHIVFPLFVLLSGLYLLFLDKAGRSAAKFQMFKRGVGVAAIALSLILFIPRGEVDSNAASGAGTALAFETAPDFNALQTRIAAARRDHKEVLIDFWATWCAECKELDKTTFHDPSVINATDKYVVLRMQLEDPDSAANKSVVQMFGIVGLPTVVHLVPADNAAQTALTN